MDIMILEGLKEFGVTSGAVLIIYLIVKVLFLSNKLNALESSFVKHVARHENWEKKICEKVEAIYNRLNPMGEMLGEIKGYMRGKDDKGK